MLLKKDWKSTYLSEFYIRKVYGEQPDLLPPPPIMEKDWKSTPLAEFYIRKVYGQRDLPPPPKPDPLRPHEFPLSVVTHRGKATDKTNFTHLQELWNGREKPLEILTAGHRERNLTTQIK